MRIAIVQPYVPAYRLPFFEGLRADLAGSDIDMTVIAGSPTGVQRARGDSRSAVWLKTVADKHFSIAGVEFSDFGARRYTRGWDAIIVPAAASCIDTHAALLRIGSNRPQVGYWGHIRSYVGPSNRLDRGIESWQLRRADHVFAYTPSGAADALDRGVRRAQLTTVMNAVDVSQLSPGTARRDQIRSELGLPDAPIYAFWGGLDSSKRIDFLAGVLDALWTTNSPAHLIVGGRGADEALLANAIERQQVTMVGYVDDAAKSKIAAAADAILMPGRIGLIAVESLALGIPIFTTGYPFHAPEAEYLVEGESMYTLPNDPVLFATALGSVSLPPRRETSWTHPTLDGMVSRFGDGVRTLIG